MAVEIPGLPPLWLTTAAGGGGGGGRAPIVVKNERLSMLGPQAWKRVRSGPYADHSACAEAGTHLDCAGHRLCVGGCVRPCLGPVPANTLAPAAGPRAMIKIEVQEKQ